MRSPPPSPQADPRGIRYRAPSTTSSGLLRTSPSAILRPLGGRISRPRSSSSVTLSLHDQRLLWEAVTGNKWELEQVDQVQEESQSLQFTGSSPLAASPAVSTASTRVAIKLEPVATCIDPKLTIAECTDTKGLLGSMESLLPTDYNHFGSVPASYQSALMANYDGYQKPRASSPHSTLLPAYTTAASPANLLSSGPLGSPRGIPIKQEDTATAHAYRSSPRPSYTSPAQVSSYPYTQAQYSATYAPSYSSPYSTAQNQYTSSHYTDLYPHQMSGYQLPPLSSYSYPSYSSGYSIQPIRRESTTAPSPARYESSSRHPCWDHGCNGKLFSTASNLLRHQREKDGTASKAECENCGALFTRTTARNGHIQHGKCKRVRPQDR